MSSSGSWEVSVSDLAKLLQSIEVPIYVVDQQRRIVFCNPACADWASIEISELLGRLCNYHSASQVSGPDAIAAALCPPPEVFSGYHAKGTIMFSAPDLPNGARQLVSRLAEFVPLGHSSDENATSLRAVPVLVIVQPGEATQEGQYQNALETTEAGASELHELLGQFRHELQRRYQLDCLLGTGAAIQRIRQQVALAAQSNSSVLIVGPHGSGRRHVARAIHYSQHVKPELLGTFIPLECAVLRADLLRGAILAMTAQSPSVPMINHRQTDTLLLADADQLSAEVQAEIVRELDQAAVSCRVIATASESLTKLATQGNYRYDLALALSTLTIELLPLAERLEDLGLLAQMFLEEQNARGGKQIGGFTPEALDRLAAYPWPDNVDELHEMVRQAHASAQGLEITVDDMPRKIKLAASAAAYPAPVEASIVLEEFLADIETELIQRALDRTRGNKSKAAKMLGMTRPRFYRRLVQLGLEELVDRSSDDALGEV